MYVASGSTSAGKLPLSHGKSPFSITIPPSVVPCPPMYFVAELAIISAPWSNGLIVPTPIVLSAMSGIPWLCAISDIFSKSGTSNFGFPMDST